MLQDDVVVCVSTDSNRFYLTTKGVLKETAVPVREELFGTGYSMALHAAREITKEEQMVLSCLHREFGGMVSSYLLAEDAVVRVLGIAFHDVRNAMGSISGICQLLAMDATEGTELFENLNDIGDVVASFEKTSVERISRYRRQDQLEALTQVDLSAVIAQALKKRSRVFALSNITLDSSIADAVQVRGTEELYSFFTQELLANAFDAFEGGKSGGEIGISLESAGSFWELSVRDTGSGIRWGEQLFVFAPFYSTKTKRNGYGLSAIKYYIEQLGGTLRFNSIPGEGSSFTITIPRIV